MNGPYSITVAWDASSTSSSNWWYCIQRDGQGCIRVDPPQTTFTFEAVAGHDVQLLRSRDHLDRETLGQQQQRHLHHAGRHDGSERADAIADRQLAGSHLRRLDGVGRRRRQPGLVHAPRERHLIRRRPDRLPVGSGPRPRAGDDLHAPGDRPRLLRQHEPEQRRHRDDSGSHRQNTTDDADEPAPVAAGLCARSGSSGIRSTDDTDPQSQILYDVYVNGVPEHLAIGYGEEFVYCRDTGPTTLTVQAIDTSGNASGHSNEIVFIC